MDTLIKKAKEIHGDKYDYSEVNYVDKKTKVIIKCKTHGIFLQTPYHHIYRNQGCKKCSYISISNVTYIRSKDSYLVSVNLYLDEPEKIDLLFPSALEMLVQRAWNGVGDKKQIILQSSFDLIP